MNRKHTRKYDGRKKDSEDERAGYRHSECSKRMVNLIENSRNIPNEKQHKWSASPEKVIVNKVDSFSYFFYFWNSF